MPYWNKTGALHKRWGGPPPVRKMVLDHVTPYTGTTQGVPFRPPYTVELQKLHHEARNTDPSANKGSKIMLSGGAVVVAGIMLFLVLRRWQIV
jgi:hypothetical protein